MPLRLKPVQKMISIIQERYRHIFPSSKSHSNFVTVSIVENENRFCSRTRNMELLFCIGLILLPFLALSCKPKVIPIEEDTIAHSDNDQDGFTSDVDCDDFDYTTNPNAVEHCDGIDNNCNGEVDEDVLLSFYEDLDGDGFGNTDTLIESCASIDGYVPFGNDCDDSNPEVYSGATEICNEVDDNCNGEVDEGVVLGLYYDADGDGYGDPNLPSSDCNGGEGYVYYADDCDDSDPTIHPFQLEICDGIDNDCNELIDDGTQYTYYADADFDGYGDPNVSIQACYVPEGYTENNLDCNDADSEQYPFAEEYCNQQDDDCDGSVDEDPVDSPIWYYDIDGDGFGSSFITVFECLAPAGYIADNSDCDDTNTSVYPGATELCNNLDNDCNGLIDDNAVNAFYWYADFDRDNFGDSSNSLYQCTQPFDYILNQNDCDDSSDDISPDAPELCNGIDDDCDGNIDNNTVDSIDYFLDGDGDGFGDPNQLIEACLPPAGYILDNSDCDDSDYDIYPGAHELCDGIDQNCNGNNFYESDLDGDGLLACEESVWFRNSSSNNTDPNGGSSQAASYLLNAGISIEQFYHGNNAVTASLLQGFGLYVHHGSNPSGAARAYTNAEANALENWVYNGGRLLYIGHSSHTACHIADSLPSQFGFSCTPNNGGWSGTTDIFTSHSITANLGIIGGEGGENWSVNPQAQSLASINGNLFIASSEYGEGKVVLVANQWPFANPGSGYRINYGDNEQLVQNIWTWLLD